MRRARGSEGGGNRRTPLPTRPAPRQPAPHPRSAPGAPSGGRPARPAGLAPLAPFVALAVALSIGACAPPATPPPGEGTPQAEATVDPNTLVWVLPAAPRSLDPARMRVDAGGAQVAAQVYDRLFRFRRDGSFGLAPGVAEDWDVDLGGKTYTFTVREGLRFHDSTPLDAPAVKWNFDRWMDPRHEGHEGDFLAWQSFFGGFVGQVDESSGRALNLVERVQALDRRTLRITLREPFAPFPFHLATLPFGLASPAAIRAQGADYGSDEAHPPVGSGPFRVQRWDVASGALLLRPYAEHWAGAPVVPALRFVTIEEAEARLDALREGVAHGTEFAAGADAPASDDLAVVPRPARDGAWLMLNHQRAPLDNPQVREALALALDREVLARDHFGPYALPAGQLLPPGFPGHDPAIAPRERDLARARALLAEAGAEEGFRLNIWIPTTPRDYLPDPRGTADAAVAMLREIGIDARVRTDSLRRFLASRDTGRFTAWIVGWQAQSPDPDNPWYWHFSPIRVSAEGQYANDSLFALLLDAQRTISADEREQMYFGAAQTVRAESPRIFLAHARSRVVLAPTVRGFAPGPMGFDDLSTLRLDGAAAETSTPAASPPAPTSTTAPTTTPEAEEEEGESDDEQDGGEDAEDEETEEEEGTAQDERPEAPSATGTSETEGEAEDEAPSPTDDSDPTLTPTPATAPGRGP